MMLKKCTFIVLLSSLFIFFLPGCQAKLEQPTLTANKKVAISGLPEIDTILTFSDSTIESETRKILGKPDGDITVKDVLSITVFGDVENSNGKFGNISGNITTLTDLRWFKNLNKLVLSGCSINDLTAIDELTKLQILYVRRNNILSLEPVRNLVNLVDFDCSDNNIKDISAVSALSNLEYLCIGHNGNDYTDLSPLKSLTKLKRLYAPWCGISDISVLGSMKELEYLQLFHNKITDISALKNLQKLNYLELGINKITDISPLEQLLGLEYISLDDNPVPKDILKKFYEPKESDYFTTIFHQKVKEDMPEYSFELLAFKSKPFNRYKTTKITVKDVKSGKIIQEILPSEHTFFGEDVTYYGDSLGFTIEDMNFDGYADIRIVEFLPAGPNIPHVCWVWNKETGQYVYDSALSGIPSLRVDHEKEIIWAFGRISAGEHFAVYYRYIDGVLTLIKEVRIKSLAKDGSDQRCKITYELIDGQWIMTEKRKVNSGG